MRFGPAQGSQGAAVKTARGTATSGAALATFTEPGYTDQYYPLTIPVPTGAQKILAIFAWQWLGAPPQYGNETPWSVVALAGGYADGATQAIVAELIGGQSATDAATYSFEAGNSLSLTPQSIVLPAGNTTAAQSKVYDYVVLYQ